MELEIISREPPSNPRPTPVLFVHGAWHGAWCWVENFMPRFAERGYACHALSLRGHGASAGRERLRCTRVADYVADVAQVVDSLPQPPVLVGHSMGGLVVQKYLESHTTPAAVLLASVPITGVLRTVLKVLAHYPLPFLKANLTLSLYPIVSTPRRARELFFSPTMPDEQVTAYFARLQDESYLAFLGMLVLELPHPKRVRTPMLVLGGEADTIFTPGQVRATARAYATQAEIFPTMAHDMMLEPGWQAVADRILDWLAERGL